MFAAEPDRRLRLVTRGPGIPGGKVRWQKPACDPTSRAGTDVCDRRDNELGCFGLQPEHRQKHPYQTPYETWCGGQLKDMAQNTHNTVTDIWCPFLTLCYQGVIVSMITLIWRWLSPF